MAKDAVSTILNVEELGKSLQPLAG
jgi:hypothetical protein